MPIILDLPYRFGIGHYHTPRQSRTYTVVDLVITYTTGLHGVWSMKFYGTKPGTKVSHVR